METNDDLISNISHIANAANQFNDNIGIYKGHSVENNIIIVDLIWNDNRYGKKGEGTIEIPLQFAKDGYTSLNLDADNNYVILKSIAKTFKSK